MPSYTWFRGTNAAAWADSQWELLAQLSNSITLRRIRFRWGFYGDLAIPGDLAGMAYNLVTFGIVTTVGDGTETPPNPRTESADAAPPLQRWLYWETRAPVVTAVDSAAGVATFRDSGSTEETSTKAQVLVTGVPEGQELDVWISVAPAYNWDPSGNGLFWWSWSLLFSS